MRVRAIVVMVAGGAAAAVCAVAGVPAASASTEPTQPAAAELDEEEVAQPPVEFTACVNPGPEVRGGTNERTVIPVAGGDMTIERQRGFTWQTPASSVTDPRLEGTWYHSYDADSYTVPGTEYGPSGEGGLLHIGVYTNRIETDEGTWEGSAVETDLSDDAQANAPVVMIGGGAYAGLIAILVALDTEGCPNIGGVIIEGSIPTPPVPSPRR